MYYYVSAWKKLGKIAHIFTAAQECLCKVGSASPLPAVNLPPPPHTPRLQQSARQ